MYCPICSREMAGPNRPVVPYPMFVCTIDGVVYDRKRQLWYGLPEIGEELHCPLCGAKMEGEPSQPPVRIFFCYQCGTTFDRSRSTWYGVAPQAP
ncbi:MAG: transposase family protein [Thermoplasmata archaeon]